MVPFVAMMPILPFLVALQATSAPGVTFLCLSDSEILLKVHEAGVDRLHLRVLDSLYEGTLHVAISLDRCNGRLIDLLLQRVDALTLVHHGITICEELVGEINDLLLRDSGDTIQFADLILPVYLIDESIHKHISSHLVALQTLVVSTFLIIDDARQEVVWEVTLLQLVDLRE